MASLNRRGCRASPRPERCRFAMAPKVDPLAERWRERMDAAAQASAILRRVVDAACEFGFDHDDLPAVLERAFAAPDEEVFERLIAELSDAIRARRAT